MRWPTATATNPQLARLDAGIILLILGLSVVSLAVWSDPGFPGVEDARALDITINVAAIFIGAGVAVLAWVRWRDTGESVALYESSAFLALTTINVLMIGLVIVGREAEFGLAADSPGAAPIYVWTITRAAAAILLVIGAARSLRREMPPLPAVVLEVAPTVGVVLSAIMLFGREAILPPVPGAEAFDPTSPQVTALSAVSAGVVVVQVAIFVGVHRGRDPVPAPVRPRREHLRRLPVGGARHRRVRPAPLRPRPGRRDRDRDLHRRPATGLLRDPADGHHRRARRGLPGAARRERRAPAAARRRCRERRAGRAVPARARDPRRPRPGPVVRQAQAGPAHPERQPGRVGSDDGSRGARRDRLRPRRGPPGGHGDARGPILRLEPRGGAGRLRRGLRGPVRGAGRVRDGRHPAAPAAADRGRDPAHRPGGTQQRPAARRRHARPRACGA